MAVVENQGLRNFQNKIYSLDLTVKDVNIKGVNLIEVCANGFTLLFDRKYDDMGKSLRKSTFMDECKELCNNALDDIEYRLSEIVDSKMAISYLDEIVMTDKELLKSNLKLLGEFYEEGDMRQYSEVDKECKLNIRIELKYTEDYFPIKVVTAWGAMAMRMRSKFLAGISKLKKSYGVTAEEVQLPEDVKKEVVGGEHPTTLGNKGLFIMFLGLGFFDMKSFKGLSSRKQGVYVASMINSSVSYALLLLLESRSKEGMIITDKHNSNIANYVRDKESETIEKHARNSKPISPNNPKSPKKGTD